jgi:hypothetical protein
MRTSECPKPISTVRQAPFDDVVLESPHIRTPLHYVIETLAPQRGIMFYFDIYTQNPSSTSSVDFPHYFYRTQIIHSSLQTSTERIHAPKQRLTAST